METCQQLLKICTEETKQLQRLAEQNQWDQLEAGLKKRDNSLRKLLALDVSTENSIEIRQAIEAIKLADQKIMALAKGNKEKIFANLKQTGQGQKMKAAYGRTVKRY